MTIDVEKLGCIMIDTETLDVLSVVEDAKVDLADATSMDYSVVPGEDVAHVILVGLTAHTIPTSADKKVEVGARVGLLHVVYVEPLPSAYRIRKVCEGRGVGSATPQLLLRHLQRQRSARYVEGDLVSGLHQCQRSAGRGLGGDV
jgi:hypothetical protein